MENLLQLAETVNRKKLMKLTILGDREDGMMDQLYLMTAANAELHLAEAADQLYGEAEDFPAFQKLKSKLKGRLADMLILIDDEVEVGNRPNVANQKIRRLWLKANFLFSKDNISLGVELAEKALELALQFEVTQMVMLISKKLRSVVALNLGDTKRYEYYDNLYQKFAKMEKAEAEVEYAYAKLLIGTVGQVPNNQEIAVLGEQLFRSIEPYLDIYDSAQIQWPGRYIQVTYLLNAQSYHQLIEASEVALKFLSNKAYSTKNTRTGFLLHQLIAYTQLRDFEKGQVVLDKCQHLITIHQSRTYFKVQELGMTLFLHSKQYQKAYELMIHKMSKSTLSEQHKVLYETWKINEAYLQYLIYTGHIKPQEENLLLSKFRLGRFLNEVPTFSRDKRGMNIPILILQTLFSIAMGKYDQTFDRMEAIQKYTTRHIRKDEHYRSNCFIKLLLQIPAAGFNRKQAEQLGKRYLKMLQEVPLHVSDQPHEIEIIPYEDLWDMALNSIKQ